MKITVETKETKEVEIQLPLFFKIPFISGDWHYAGFDEKNFMIVKPTEIQCFDFPNVVMQFIHDKSIQMTTEEEFTEAFETTMERIQAMMPVIK